MLSYLVVIIHEYSLLYYQIKKMKLTTNLLLSFKKNDFIFWISLKQITNLILLCKKNYFIFQISSKQIIEQQIDTIRRYHQKK